MKRGTYSNRGFWPAGRKSGMYLRCEAEAARLDKRYSFGGPAGPRVECFGWQDASITASVSTFHQNHSLDALPPPQLP